jgi:hypothetical protein
MPRALWIFAVSLALLAQAPKGEPMANFAGVLKQIDKKGIVIELGDNRVLEFARNAKTRFVEVKEAELKPGDHISVEALQDAAGFLTAVNVRLEAHAEGRDEAPKPAPPAPPRPTATEGDVAYEAAESDPDRPRLRRGVPPKRKPSAPEPDKPEPVASAAPPREPAVPAAPPREAAPAQAAAESTEDPVIEKARAAGEGFTESLPNYTVQQITSRYQSSTSKPDWKPLDVVSADVIYENKRESYRNLKINGKPVNLAMNQLSGAWSTGEFGTILRNLLAPETAARFRLRKQAIIAGRAALVYGYDVDRENSTWLVKMGSQSVEPAYRGAIWIDKETARVLRIEMEAVDLPSAFPLDKCEISAEYGPVRLGTTAEYILPVQAETLSCQRGTSVCSRNRIDYRNYHKFAGESSITYQK